MLCAEININLQGTNMREQRKGYTICSFISHKFYHPNVLHILFFKCFILQTTNKPIYQLCSSHAASK